MLHFEEEIDHVVRCPQCGKPLESGRTDKRFCSQACKNRWHNRQRLSNHDKEIQRVLRVLNRNREVLERLLKLGLRSVDRPTLIHLGFNMNYFTSLHRDGSRRWIYSCLDIRYELTPTRIKNISFLWEGAGSEEQVKSLISRQPWISSGDL